MENDNKLIGTVCWFTNTYGFISRPGEKDLFVHYSDIISKGYRTLKKGQKVSYGVGLNHRGDPKAIEVVVLSDE